MGHSSINQNDDSLMIFTDQDDINEEPDEEDLGDLYDNISPSNHREKH